MEKEKLKLKNLKDLEHSNILNNKNIVLVLLGTFLITLALSDQPIFTLIKTKLLIALGSIGALSLLYFNRRLNKVMHEIKEL